MVLQRKAILINVYLTKEQRRLWRMEAASREISTSELVRQTMSEMLARTAEGIERGH